MPDNSPSPAVLKKLARQSESGMLYLEVERGQAPNLEPIWSGDVSVEAMKYLYSHIHGWSGGGEYAFHLTVPGAPLKVVEWTRKLVGEPRKPPVATPRATKSVYELAREIGRIAGEIEKRQEGRIR